MGVVVAVIPFVTSATSPQNITDSGQLGGLTPKLAIIVGSLFNGTTGGGDPDAAMVKCLTDGTTAKSVGFISEDGQIRGDTAGFIGDDFRLHSDADGTVAYAGVPTLITDGLRITWTTTDTDKQCYAILLAGSDVDAVVGEAFRNQDNAGTHGISGLSFEPDLVLNLHWSSWSTDNAQQNSANMGWGATHNGASLAHRSSTFGNQHNPITMALVERTQDDACAAYLWLLALQGTAICNNFVSDGFDVVLSETGSLNDAGFFYAAINFGGAVNVALGSTDSPTSTGNWEFTDDPGFVPQVCFLFTGSSTAYNTTVTSGEIIGGFGISAFNTDTELSLNFRDRDAAADSLTDTFYDTKALAVWDYTGGKDYIGTLTSFDSAGPNIDVTTENDGSTRKWWYIAIEEFSGGHTGTAAQTLPALNQVGTGVAGEVGTATQTLPTVTQQGTGVETQPGSAAQTLPAATQVGTGEQPHEATAAQSLPAVTQAGTGVETQLGSAAQALPAVAQAATGVQTQPGAAAQILPSVNQAGTGVAGEVGTATQALPALVQSATGVEILIATAAQTLPSITQVGTGTHAVGHTATAAQALPPITQVGTGEQPHEGTAAQALPSVNQAGTGVETQPGTGAQSLPSVTQAGTGNSGGAPTGTGALTLPALIQAAVGIETQPGAAAQTLAALMQAATGVQILPGTGAQVLPAVVQAAAGGQIFVGTSAIVLPAVTQAGTGEQPHTATAAMILPAVTQAGTGVMQPFGTAAMILPAVTQAGTGETPEIVDDVFGIGAGSFSVGGLARQILIGGSGGQNMVSGRGGNKGVGGNRS